MLYYADIENTQREVKAQEFQDGLTAISCFKRRYGLQLMAVILDKGDALEVIWERNKK